MASRILAAANDAVITGGAATALSFTSPGAFRSIVVHMISGTAPVAFTVETSGALPPTATTYTDGGELVLHDGLRARELSLPGGLDGRNVNFSFFSSANAVVYVELMR